MIYYTVRTIDLVLSLLFSHSGPLCVALYNQDYILLRLNMSGCKTPTHMVLMINDLLKQVEQQ